MNAGDGDAWKQDLELLRKRIEDLESEQRKTLAELRTQLWDLEASARQRTPAQAALSPVPADISSELKEPALPTPVIQPKPPAAPPPLPPAKLPTPQPVVLPPPPRTEPGGGIEMQLGRVWLVRFGIVLLLTGLVLLGNFAYKNWIREMPNGVRLFGLFACAGLLMETGRRLAAKPALQRFGEVILAGGMSFFYYCTFAAHHVPRLKVIDSAVFASVLLLGAAGLIAAVSWLRNARATAVLGVLLASYSTMLQPIGWLSCVSSVILAGVGLFLMRRPGWVGPGVASMVGTYGAFLGWQLMGASGARTDDPAVMWFLPPVWIMLALPGVLDRFRATMSARARAWFTGGNNAAFFTLFSGLWWQRYEGADYWVVCAAFGLVLLALGVLGRRRGEIAGGVNVFQGLTLLSLALVIRLEGYHLALGLAVESLALALGFAKFRGRSELAFSCLAALGAMGFTLFWQLPVLKQDAIPLWSAGLAALLVAASSVVLRVASSSASISDSRSSEARLGACLVFCLGVVTGIAGWALWLPVPWPAPVMAGIAAALSAGMLLIPRGTKMLEIGFGALAFLVVAAWPAVQVMEWWPVAIAGGFALGAAWLWHWRERGDDPEFKAECDPALHGWVYSLAAVAAAGWAILHHRMTPSEHLIWSGGTSFMLLAFAIFGKVRRLAPCAAALILPAAGSLVLFGAVPVSDALWITGFPLAMLALLLGFGKHLPQGYRDVSGWIARATAFFGTCLFWEAFAPGFGGDGLAITAAALLAIAIFRKIRAMPEVWGFLGLSVLWLLNESHGPWLKIGDEATWRGWAVVLALAGLVVWTGVIRRGGSPVPGIVAGWAASIIGSMWATQMLVWRHDWHAVSVLWTLLGFAAVSAGLWVRLAALRQAGFVLLGMALIKVFAMDVWDFNAFMRVIAFIVLGAALILLGLFYNHFAPVLKRLLEDEHTTS